MPAVRHPQEGIGRDAPKLYLHKIEVEACKEAQQARQACLE